MKLHFHNWKMIRWRLVHYPEYEPSRIVVREKCSICGKERNRFPNKERNRKWENNNRKLEGYWHGDEKELEQKLLIDHIDWVIDELLKRPNTLYIEKDYFDEVTCISLENAIAMKQSLEVES